MLCVCAAAWCSQALAAAAAVAAAGGRSDSGNFLDDKQWLTTISQYDKEVGQWNKFRDVSAAHRHSRAHGSAAARRGPRRPGAGGQVGSVFPAERRRGPRRRWAAGELGRSGAPSRPARGEGSRAGGAGVRVSPGSLRTAPFPLPPPKVRKVLSRPSQLLNGVSGTSKHGRCAFAMYCYESNWDRSLY